MNNYDEIIARLRADKSEELKRNAEALKEALDALDDKKRKAKSTAETVLKRLDEIDRIAKESSNEYLANKGLAGAKGQQKVSGANDNANMRISTKTNNEKNEATMERDEEITEIQEKREEEISDFSTKESDIIKNYDRKINDEIYEKSMYEAKLLEEQRAKEEKARQEALKKAEEERLRQEKEKLEAEDKSIKKQLNNTQYLNKKAIIMGKWGQYWNEAAQREAMMIVITDSSLSDIQIVDLIESMQEKTPTYNVAGRYLELKKHYIR